MTKPGSRKQNSPAHSRRWEARSGRPTPLRPGSFGKWGHQGPLDAEGWPGLVLCLLREQLRSPWAGGTSAAEDGGTITILRMYGGNVHADLSHPVSRDPQPSPYLLGRCEHPSPGVLTVRKDRKMKT